jgi:hypothetical protein
MSLIDFGFDATAPATVTRTQRRPAPAVTTVAPVVVETVTVVAKPSQAAGFVMRDEQAWGWQDLRDYVIREIEQRHGPQVRDPKKEAAIFKSFLTRWSDSAVAIAKAAFEVHGGMWRGAPISVNRFCLASDEYFAAVIAKNL